MMKKLTDVQHRFLISMIAAEKNVEGGRLEMSLPHSRWGGNAGFYVGGGDDSAFHLMPRWCKRQYDTPYALIKAGALMKRDSGLGRRYVVSDAGYAYAKKYPVLRGYLAEDGEQAIKVVGSTLAHTGIEYVSIPKVKQHAATGDFGIGPTRLARALMQLVLDGGLDSRGPNYGQGRSDLVTIADEGLRNEFLKPARERQAKDRDFRNRVSKRERDMVNALRDRLNVEGDQWRRNSATMVIRGDDVVRAMEALDMEIPPEVVE